MAEISRVLRPGGVFVASTYILDGPFAFVPFLRTFRQVYILFQLGNCIDHFTSSDLSSLCTIIMLNLALDFVF